MREEKQCLRKELLEAECTARKNDGSGKKENHISQTRLLEELCVCYKLFDSIIPGLITVSKIRKKCILNIYVKNHNTCDVMDIVNTISWIFLRRNSLDNYELRYI